MTHNSNSDRYHQHQLLCDWLTSSSPTDGFNTFLTLPLKQSVYAANGNRWPNSRENCENLACKVRTRLGKRLGGSRKGKLMFAASFYEEGRGKGQGCRMHIHMLIQRPQSATLERVDEEMRRFVMRNEWLCDDIDVLPITETPERVLGYCLKEGFDALLLRATVFPR